MPRLVRLLPVCVIAFAVASSAPRAVSPDIVISQVYGGGGNSGATLTNDFIELFNRGTSPVTVTGWSVQYASSAGTAWQRTDLNGTVPAGGYYLVQQAAGAGGTTPLPVPDATGGIAMSATSGKVALVANTTTLTGSCPSGLVDFVGFGTANCFEGPAATAVLSNTTAALRNDAGCTDTDNNAADFSVGAPGPRNSAAPLHACSGPPTLTIADVALPEGNGGTATATFLVQLSAPAPPGGVTFDIATEDGTATAAGGDYDARALTSQTIAEGGQSYAFDVTINGDTAIEAHETFLVRISNVAAAVLGDDSATGTIQNDDVAPPAFDVVISQVYGGGGNSGATYTHDFVELFNRGTTTVSLTGWSVQYTSAAGTGTWLVTPLAGSIAPGRYHLVQQAAGAGGTTALPPPDTLGTIPMGAGSGKVALFTSTAAMSGACPAGVSLVDLVGYGSTACFEGLSGPAGGTSNTTAAVRKRGGCVDANDNAADFLVSSPTPRNSATFRSCDYLTRTIHEIQGSGAQTPMLGQDVITTGIVTARKSNGFFTQTADVDADGDPATSQGIFVFTGAPPTAAIGDAVLVKGTANEFFGLTQIESTLPGDVTIQSSGSAQPLPILLTSGILDPAGAPGQLERFEGMVVHAPTLVSVGPTNEFGEIPAVLGGVTRPMREPGVEISHTLPPDPVTGLVDCCIPRWDENPERIAIDSDGLLGSPAVWVTSNVSFASVMGPLDFSFGGYKLLPAALVPTSPNASAAPVPAPASNEFTVAGYNIENFTSGNAAQLAKAALAIRTVLRAPDVIGVVEIANLSSLQALASRVNADAAAAGEPNPAYEARLVPASPTATQNVGFLVKTSRVRIDGVTQELADETFTNPVTGLPETLHDRPPLVLRATVGDPSSGHGGPIVVVVNHLRSFIDIELVSGEGVRVRAKRAAQAESVAALLHQLQTGSPATPVVSVGDYNAFEFSDGYTDPIATLKGAPTPGDQLVVSGSPDLVDPNFVNLTDALPADERYSFVFEGTPQALDHVLVNAVAHALLQRYAIARGNADFPSAPGGGYAADTTRPEANSDHDMPVAYFAFPGTPVVTLNGAAEMTVEAYTAFTDPGATAHDDRGPLPVTVSGAVDVNVPGDYVLSYTATNGFQTTTVTRTVHVVDSTAPAVGGFAATPSSLGEPNHALVDVALRYQATDASGAVACSVAVTSNEPVNGLGDGNTAADWVIVSSTHVQLRAERSGRGGGRVYTLTLTCTDNAGNQAVATTTVTVR